ncbi:MAG TPA: hypothetical protein DEO60_11290 [Bacteroidales bacterium]|nr:hypothetical protein [Bacteroidales bacterium]HBZ21704.1 hypothetical protein [Bacteroidales bacterium]
MKIAGILSFLCLEFIGQIQSGAQVTHIQEIYKTVDTSKLKIDIFYDKKSLERDNNTAIVFLHGGGWSGGSYSEFFTTCERYARMGIISFSVDYRLSTDNGLFSHNPISPIECLMDVKSAIRWVRENAGNFHIDVNKIVAAGQSAGGQLALATVMTEDFNEISDNTKISCKPDAVLLFSACVNTLEGWCDRLLADRRNKIWSISPTHNMKSGLPPMIDFHGTDDEQVPVWTARFFESEMKKLDNYFELHIYNGRKHYLGEGNQKYSRYYNDEILGITDEFLRKFHFLE